MIATALEALVGTEPADEAVSAALSTVPAAELGDALRWLAREHGAAAIPVLRRCLAGRPAWAIAAAAALATIPAAAAVETLAAADAARPEKPVRTAVRRALYRLRQAGLVPAAPAPAPRPRPPSPRPAEAWVSAVDGTGARGVWLVLEGALGERTLLSAVLSDETGILDLGDGAITRKRLDERLRALRAESPLPWVAVPAAWAAALLAEARTRHAEAAGAWPGEAARWLARLPEAGPATPPIWGRLEPAAVAQDPTLLERSADLLALPELAGWFLEPSALTTEALELLQARESRLVVSDQVKAERAAALIDRVIDAQLTPDARRRWQRRLEETAFVLVETARPAEARLAAAAALALADPARPARHIPFVRALVERSLEVAGEVALGRVSAGDVSRRPRRPGAPVPR